MKQIFSVVLAISLFASCQKPATKPLIPESITYLSRETWGAKPPVLPMREHQLTRLTIHHTGTMQQPDRSLTDKMKSLQKFSQEDSPLANGSMKPAWADVPYHFYVAVTGEVAEARDIHYAGDTNTTYDPAGHLLVVVEGNFDKEAITPEQMKTLALLVPALAKRYAIPADSLAGHKDFAQTSCPGNALYAQLPHLQKLISSQQ